MKDVMDDSKFKNAMQSGIKTVYLYIDDYNRIKYMVHCNDRLNIIGLGCNTLMCIE